MVNEIFPPYEDVGEKTSWFLSICTLTPCPVEK